MWRPLAVFLLGTLISLALSDNPRSGMPQVKKLFVFLMLAVVYTAFQSAIEARGVVLGWAAVAAVSGIVSFFQFGEKYLEARAAHVDFYQYYVGERTTGFMSHWMTFGGLQMVVLLMLSSLLFFGPAVSQRLAILLWSAVGVLAASIYFGETRSIWLAVAVGGSYLLWNWRRWVLLVVPAILVVLLWLNVGSARDRFISAFQPHGETDSNQHRIVTWRTGVEMVRRHPWFGLGPERVGAEFRQYVPADIHTLPVGWYGHLHNIYLQYAAERGIPVLLALLWMFATMFYDYFRALRAPPPGRSDTRFLLRGAIATLIAIMVAGIFEHNLGDSEVLALFLVVTAFGYLGVDSSREPANV